MAVGKVIPGNSNTTCGRVYTALQSSEVGVNRWCRPGVGTVCSPQEEEEEEEEEEEMMSREIRECRRRAAAAAPKALTLLLLVSRADFTP